MTTSAEPAGQLIGKNNSADDPELADNEGSGSDQEKSLSDEHSNSSEKQPMSMRRRLAFVGTLLLCVFTVFTFAFLLPCHKPKCKKASPCPGHGELVSVNWSNSFRGITSLTLSQIDGTDSGNPDILVEFHIEVKEVKNSLFLRKLCRNSSCHGSGLLALHGSSGISLWNLTINSTFGLLVCDKVDNTKDQTEFCLLLEQNNILIRINTSSGTQKWRSALLSKVYSLVFVDDLDGDSERDIVFVHQPNMNLSRPSSVRSINMISGATGQILGKSVNLPRAYDHENNSAVLAVHTLASGDQFIVVGMLSYSRENSSSLWAMSVHDLLEKIRHSSKVFPVQPWGNHKPNSETGFISIMQNSPTFVQPLLVDINGDKVKDIIVCIRGNSVSLLALDGNNLHILWKKKLPFSAVVHRLFSVRHSLQDNSTNIAIFITYTNNSSELLSVSGTTGTTTWSFLSPSVFPVAPVSTPLALPAFVIWLPKLETLHLVDRYGSSFQKAQRMQEDENTGGKGLSKQTEQSLISLQESPVARQRRAQSDYQKEQSVTSHMVLKFLQYYDDLLQSWHDETKDSSPFSLFNEEFENSANVYSDEDGSLVSRRQAFLELLRHYDDLLELWRDTKDSSPLSLFNEKSENAANVYSDEDDSLFSRRQAFLELFRRYVDLLKSWHDDTKDSSPFSSFNGDLEGPESTAKADGDENNDWFSRHEAFLDLLSQLKANSLNQPQFARSNPASESVEESINENQDDTLSDKNTLELERELNDLTIGSNLGQVSKASHGFLLQDHLVPVNVDQFSLPTKTAQHPRPKHKGKEKNFVNRPEDTRDYRNVLLEDQGSGQRLTLVEDDTPSHHKRSLEYKQTGAECLRHANDSSVSLVAFLLSADSRGKQQFVKLVEEGPLYLGADEHMQLFTEGVVTKPCLRLVPRLTSEPVLRNTEEGLDLVYTISYVSENHSIHVGTVRKISLIHTFEELKRKISQQGIFTKHILKRQSDYSFPFPRPMK